MSAPPVIRTMGAAFRASPAAYRQIGRLCGCRKVAPTSRVCSIHGMFGSIRVEDRPYNGLMPPPAFDDAEIADGAELRADRAEPRAAAGRLRSAHRRGGRRLSRAEGDASEMRKNAKRCWRSSQAVERCRRSRGSPASPRTSRASARAVTAPTAWARATPPRLREFVGYFTRLPEGRDYLMRAPGVVFAPIDDQRLAAVLNWTLATFSPARWRRTSRRSRRRRSRAAGRPDREVRATREGLARSCARRACSPVTTMA